MAFDFKKEYREYNLPPQTPVIVDIPPMNYVATRGKGNPNEEDSEYKASIELLYGIAFTIKMSKMGDHRIEGYFDFVVPPLEGLWWSETGEVDYGRKQDFHFISMLRLPDFVTREDFDWAAETATKKKKKDFSKAEFFHYEEGLSIAIDDKRRHHEIYLSDPRKTAADKLRTVIRYPVK